MVNNLNREVDALGFSDMHSRSTLCIDHLITSPFNSNLNYNQQKKLANDQSSPCPKCITGLLIRWERLEPSVKLLGEL